MLNDFVARFALDLTGPGGVLFDFTSLRLSDFVVGSAREAGEVWARLFARGLRDANEEAFAIFTPNWVVRRTAGKGIVEDVLPSVDLTYVVDLSGCYVPGHGEPTLLLVGRVQRPVAPGVRVVVGVRGEPRTPEHPERGLAWQSVLQHVHQPGTRNEYVRSATVLREALRVHPWSFEELVP